MNLPTKFKIRHTSKFYNYKHPFLLDKSIVRKLADNKLPVQLTRKKKSGFPSYALRNATVKPDFFKNGHVSDIMQLDSKQIKYMCSNFNNYNTALLASVEIWCKLFVENESVENVAALISNHISIA